jgi:ASC-1-like (ASCH) protein
MVPHNGPANREELGRRIACLRRSGHYRSCLVEFPLTEGDVCVLRTQRPLGALPPNVTEIEAAHSVFVASRPGCRAYPFEVHFAPAKHEMTLNDPWFDLVRSGKKRFEGRRCTPKVREIRAGDTIEFSHHVRGDASDAAPFSATVTGTRWFASFERALDALGVDAVLPSVPTVAEGVDVYRRFVSDETQRRDGVCMLELRSTARTPTVLSQG